MGWFALRYSLPWLFVTNRAPPVAAVFVPTPVKSAFAATEPSAFFTRAKGTRASWMRSFARWLTVGAVGSTRSVFIENIEAVDAVREEREVGHLVTRLLLVGAAQATRGRAVREW